MTQFVLDAQVDLDTERREALEQALAAVLPPDEGPWTVTLRPGGAWQASADWSVQVARPGSVWTLRATPEQQEPAAFAAAIGRLLRP